MLPLQMPLARTLPRREVRRPRAHLSAADETGRDLRGCGDDARRVVSVHLLRTLHPRPWRARVQVRASAPVSMDDVTRLLELPPERYQARRLVRRLARPAHHRRTLAARARVPGQCLLPCWSQSQSSCGASGARSSICAYSLLVAHRRVMEQSADGGGEDTRGGDRVIGSSKFKMPLPFRWPDDPMAR